MDGPTQILGHGELPLRLSCSQSRAGRRGRLRGERRPMRAKARFDFPNRLVTNLKWKRRACLTPAVVGGASRISLNRVSVARDQWPQLVCRGGLGEGALI